MTTTKLFTFYKTRADQSELTEFVTTPLDSGSIAVIMDAEPERSAEVIDDDISKPSYRTEKLFSEASNVSLPSRKQQ